MNKDQQDLRRHAAEQFVQSFDKELLGSFQEGSETTPTPVSPPPEPKQSVPKVTAAPQPTKPISLSDLEEAISDIEQYLQSRQQRIVAPDSSEEE